MSPLRQSPLLRLAGAGLFLSPEVSWTSVASLPLEAVAGRCEARPYSIRAATTADLPVLLALEEACWAPALRAREPRLRQRIKRHPSGQFVLEMDGQVAAVLYSQRIADASLLRGVTADTVETHHIPRGRIVQLLAVNVLPEMQHLGLGDQLLSFVLQASAHTDEVEHVLAVSLCRDYQAERGVGLEDYIRQRDAGGLLIDPILRFHEAHGAAITGLVPGYRPADAANLGCGVLVEYTVASLRNGSAAMAERAPAGGAAPAPSGHEPLSVVEACIRHVKPGLEDIPAARPLMELGLDSLDLMRLRAALSDRFAVKLHSAFFFSHSTAEAIAAYFQEPRERVEAPPRAAPAAARADDIAIVGAACRLPGGVVSTDQFWELLRDGRDAIADVPPSRWDIDAFCDPHRPDGPLIATRYGGFVDDVDQFDAAFFNIGTGEANALDPQQRLLLEVAWEALEQAGVDPRSLAAARGGIFVGIFSHDYELLQVKRNAEAGRHDSYYATGGAASIAAGRLAYVLGCQGPALAVDTACSSSLVAVHLACRSLLSGECDVALAGGVNLMLSPELSVSFSAAGMLAPDGRCKTFDAAADGYVRSEGCGLVVLKPLSQAMRDGDNVLAVIRGSATSHDGFSNGLTAPNGRAQAQAIRGALAAAGVSPLDVSYVEAHGTGTPLGDPVEVRALAEVYCEGRDAATPLVVGSVKANIGHAEAAAGVAGLIKVVLALQHRQVPAQLHYRRANPEMDLGSVPIVIPSQGLPWRPPAAETPLVAGISSFGFSGTNAHVIVAEAPRRAVPQRTDREWHAFTLSAASMPALRALAARFETFLAGSDCSIEEICHTVNTGRAHLECRLGAVARSTTELAALLGRFREDAGDEALVVGRATRTTGDPVPHDETGWPTSRAGVIELVRRHVAGGAVDWRRLNDGRELRKVPLPTYAFERKRYWLPDAHEPQRRSTPAAVNGAAPSLDDLLYQVEWRERAAAADAARGLLAPHAVADLLAAPARPDGSLDGLAPALATLSATYIAEAFRSLGWNPIAGPPPDPATLGVVKEQQRFAEWLAAILRTGAAESGGPSADDQRRALAARYPAADAELTVLGRCASRLADVLRGTVDPLGLLFPEADLTAATRLYEASPTFAPMNRLLADAVRAATGALPQGARLRVLEIGAGTGGTTSSLLKTLEGRIDEYVFTDVSPLFLGKARARFGGLPFVSYRALDVERDPADQGLGAERFDLVIASNVLHATRDLRATLRHARSLVAPGGMLVLVEGTRHTAWVDLIFGMLGGWWRFADHDLRPACPLLPAATWERELAEAGFSETTALLPADDSGLFEQAVLLARAPETAAAMAASPTAGARHWIIFSDSAGIGGELAARFEQRGDTCTQVPMPRDGQPPDRDALAPLADMRPFGCVHLWSLDAPDGSQLTVEALDAANRSNCASVLHVAQAMIGADLATPPRLWLVTRGAVAAGNGAVPGVAQSALWGLGQVLSAEHPEFRCTHVDLDAAAPHSANVEWLAGEILSEAGATHVALRGGTRFEAEVTRLPANRIAAATPPAIHADRTYLIAGGLGALGLEVAGLLVDRGARHLVLVSRGGVAAPGSRAAGAVAELERRGATVRLVAADISRPADVTALFEVVAQAGPAIAGVVHAAGVFDDRLLADHDWPLFERVLAAKVSGAWNLHQASRALPLDFFALFGSATTMVCSAGLGNYVAANSFLDALALHRRALGLPAVSIAWGPWAGVGMAEAVGGARQAQWANDGLTQLDRHQALEAFARLVGGGAPAPAAVAVMAMDWQRYGARHPEAARSTWLGGVVPAADTPIATTVRHEEGTSLARQLRALPAPERRARLVAHISAEITNVLALPAARAVDPEVGLFRMGLDSLTSMELRNRLQRALDCALPPTLTFKYPTVRELADHLAQRLGAEHEPAPTATPATVPPVADAAEPIAIVGMGCRFPGGVASPDDFWELLRGGVDAVGELPADRWDIDDYFDPAPGTPGKTYVRAGGYLDRIDTFDPAFFGISPREAASMDPQHRLFLEVCWEALEHAGIPPTSLAGTRSAVFAGIGQDDYAQRRLRSGAAAAIDHYDGTGNLYCFAPGRLSYFLGLRGPNMAVDTACSSSLVAVQLAVQSLRNRESDLALAGAVHLAIAPDVTLFLSQARVLSPDGRCKTFAARADGFGRGEGCGAVVLKRLSDAERDGDRVLALIRGAAVNHDGRSSGLTVPNETAQVEVIQQALQSGAVSPAQVSYVEAHGTGTSLGDPIEVSALVGALCADRPKHTPLLIGSVKTNVGHLEAAAGMAGLIKVVLAMQHGEIPPHLHCDEPSPHIAWDQISVEVTARARPWPRTGVPRVAGVSSFGFSGTNAHVLIEEAPEPARPRSSNTPRHVLPLSARSGAALRRMAERYRHHLSKHPDQNLRDLCGTASSGRSHFRHRLAIVGSDAIGVRQRLDAFLAGRSADGVHTGEVIAHGDPDRRLPDDLTPDQIATHFVAGDVDWARIYPRRSFAVVDLPTYPFERERYWIDAPAARAIAPIVFSTSVGTSSPAWLDHHRVFGAAVYPAAAFVELALAAGRSAIGEADFALEDVEILRALVLPETGAIDLRTTLTPDGTGGYAFNIQSEGTGADPVTHVSGRITRGTSSLAAASGLAAARNACDESVAVPRFYKDLAECGLSFGEDFRALHELRRGAPRPGSGAGRSLGGVRLPVGLLRDSGTYAFHPVLLDACFQSSMALWPADAGSATYLPVSIERVEARPSTSSELWSVATPRAAHGAGGGRVVDFEIADASGIPVAKVTGLALRASSRAALFRSPTAAPAEWRRWLHAAVWREVPLQRIPRTARRWAVFADHNGIGTHVAERLEARGETVTQIPSGHREVFDRLSSDRAAGPLHIVDLRGLDASAAVDSGQSVPDAAYDHCEHVLSMLHAAERAAGSLAGLWLVTRGAQAAGGGADVAVEQAPLWGLEKVIALERPELTTACIDLDPAGGEDDAQIIVDELSGAADGAGVAYRAGRRYETRLAPHQLAEPAPATPRVRADATYLITGGFGALGSQVALWLASHGARHLVLCGRREPPAPARQAIAGLERRGVRVTAAHVDVSDAAAVAELIASIAASPAPLRGIVHAAGVVEDAALARITPEALRRAFAPKVHGAWNLHHATAGVPLDFFVCFSSAAALIGSAGQGAYAAANAFMDALAARRRTLGLCGTSINWGAWSGGGMASATAASVQARWSARGFGSLAPDAGLQVLERAIGGPAPNIGVLPIDWARYLPETYGDRVPPLFEELAAQQAATAAASPAPGLGESLHTVSADEARARLTEIVRAAVMATLGLRSAAAIDARTSFFEIGLDSLTATELRHRLRSVLGREINATVVFDYPTLERLVEHLLGQIVHLRPDADGAGPDLSLLQGEGARSFAVPPAPGSASPDDARDQPLEQAIAKELAELESLLAGSSNE